ncbi:MAG: flagellar FlbD family protein [Terriglobales bacterium]
MIRLTRFNRQTFVVNSDAIKFVESAPDTTVTLMNGERLLVLESVEEVVARIIAFRREIWPSAARVSPRRTGPQPCGVRQ